MLGGVVLQSHGERQTGFDFELEHDAVVQFGKMRYEIPDLRLEREIVDTQFVTDTVFRSKLDHLRDPGCRVERRFAADNAKQLNTSVIDPLHRFEQPDESGVER